MPMIGRRECYLIRINSQNVERLVEQVNSALVEMGVPHECSVKVFKNFFNPMWRSMFSDHREVCSC